MCVSRRYCSKREVFFVTIDKCAIFLNILSGTFVVAGLSEISTIQNYINEWHLSFIGGSAVIIISLLSLIFEWSEKSRHYGKQKRGYIALIEQFHRLGQDMTHDQLNKMRADFTLMVSNETEPNNRVVEICFEEEKKYRDAENYK